MKAADAGRADSAEQRRNSRRYKVSHVSNGAIAIAEFLGPRGEPVDHDTAQRRADVCMRCSLNKSAAGWDGTITEIAAKATKAYFRIKSEKKLEVDGEDRLGICQACWCPLKLKVHMPIDHITEYTEDEVLADLDMHCWILKEMV